MKVRHGLLKYISPETPRDIRIAVAGADARYTEGLSSSDLVTVLFVLTYDKDTGVAAAARRSLEDISSLKAVEALGSGRLDPKVIKRLVDRFCENDAVLTMAALNPATDDGTLAWLAEHGPEEVVTLLTEDKARLLRSPGVFEALRKNPGVPSSVITGLETCLKTMTVDDAASEVEEEADQAEELAREPDEQNIYKAVQGMSVPQKIKLALTGNRSVRDCLLKESNKVVSMAVLKNPKITEDELQKLTASKNTPEDLLRAIARNKEWVKNYSVKLGMVVNAKTPLSISLKFMDYLYESDLAKLAKSKNVPSVLASAARRKLEHKRKH